MTRRREDAIKEAAGRFSKEVLTAALTVAGLEVELAAAVGVALAVGNDAFWGAVECAQGNLLGDS